MWESEKKGKQTSGKGLKKNRGAPIRKSLVKRGTKNTLFEGKTVSWGKKDNEAKNKIFLGGKNKVVGTRRAGDERQGVSLGVIRKRIKEYVRKKAEKGWLMKKPKARSVVHCCWR